MSQKIMLVNYRIPLNLKNEFQEICTSMHVPMSTQVNILMREFVFSHKARNQESSDSHEPIQIFSDYNDHT
jgi:antitoxin component of RelBE/YafQ-DinJ toxin-antitoxin module